MADCCQKHYESDLSIKLFEAHLQIVRLQAELSVLNPKVEDIQNQCDSLVAELKQIQSSEDSSQESKSRHSEIIKELRNKWPRRCFLKDNQKRANDELEKVIETSNALKLQKLHFEAVHKK